TFIVISNLYTTYSHYILVHRQIEQPILAIESPRSGAYGFATITVSGEEWLWFQGQSADHPIRPDSVTINIYGFNGNAQAVTVEPKTLIVIPHQDPAAELYHQAIRGHNE